MSQTLGWVLIAVAIVIILIVLISLIVGLFKSPRLQKIGSMIALEGWKIAKSQLINTNETSKSNKSGRKRK